MNELRRWGRVTLIAALVAVAAAAGGALEGKRFAGETGEAGKTKGDPEEFVFADGKFDPLACHQYGFAATPYSARPEGDAVAFEAEHGNAKGERMRWVGTVRGDRLEGTMTYWDAERQASEYWFKATLAK